MGTLTNIASKIEAPKSDVMKQAAAEAQAPEQVAAVVDEGGALDIPPFLKRPPMTDEERKKYDAKIARANSPNRKIKNPPKKASAESKKLGMAPSELRKTGATMKTDTPKAKKVDPAKRVRAEAKAAKAAKNAGRPKRAPRAVDPSTLRPDGLRKGSGMATLVDTVCRKSGATNEELCKAVGWAQCLPMMKKACDKAGVKLRTEKVEGKPTRYYGTPKKAA